MDSFFLCVHPETLGASYKVKKFSTMNDDILTMKDWLLENNCKDVCMGSTGKYWIPVFNTLEPHMDNTVLTHPKYVRAIKGKKTDKRDAKWIANLFRFDIVKSSFIPPSDIRAMRELSRYRLKLSHMATSEKNRYQDSMTISRIRLDSVLSDPFGRSASAIMGYLLSTETIDDEKVLSMVDSRVKASREDILRSVHGFKILAEQKFKMEHAQSHLDMINASIAEINSEINKLCAPYEKQVRNITTVPGSTSLSASYLIAEIGTDMSVFESDKHFISWCGVCPASNNSADRNKPTRIGIAKSYQDYIFRTDQDMYGSKKLVLPKPELYVIYTGNRKKRPEYISYAEEFFHGQECCVDIEVKMIYDGKAGDIIDQYITFTKVFDDQVKACGLTEKAVREAIRICMGRNILKKYLEGRESEVVDIMLTLFSQEEVWDMQMRSRQKEAAENAVRPVLLAMKNSARRMFREGKLKAGEVAEYFPDLVRLLKQTKDPRNQSYITYPNVILLMTRILSSIFYISNMRKTSQEFNSETVIQNIWESCGKTTLSEHRQETGKRFQIRFQ